ncbi:hypothetical protein ISF_01258 [Cordyceps fumosorosea ARSEF 2679]|uniref:Uncharacterized protein n=1 Tax=Cordyceps fumosorosea (strain ARSEF 2679) TaxID=1081104 RepID=A0A162IPB1_CORFA|nr:hypothetical protein ISF_01258 [Cordyceps fumosorosea ARSEF 2679]OAA72185.1 hypothetical protein ISF_01258 [Cordyceps fumosorosea ARSEF 2679]
MHVPSFLVSGLLLLGAGLTNAANTIDNEVLCDGHPPAPGTKDYEMYMRNCQGIQEEDVKKPVAPTKPVKKINCAEVLKNGNKIDCQGLSHKGCTLRNWEWAGCKKAPECKGKSGEEAKKCADDRDVLPFGAGVYYTGYMRAAVPQYTLKKTDEPTFKDLPCEKLNPFDCTGLNKYFCQFRSWQAAGCIQNAKCKSATDKKACCDNRDRDPSGPFNQTFLLEFNNKCMA